jgi:hypothetical protein
MRDADQPQPKDIPTFTAAGMGSGSATPTSPAIGSPTSGTEALEHEVKNLKSMMAQQNRQMASQGQSIADLLEEMKSLRAKMG